MEMHILLSPYRRAILILLLPVIILLPVLIRLPIVAIVQASFSRWMVVFVGVPFIPA